MQFSTATVIQFTPVCNNCTSRWVVFLAIMTPPFTLLQLLSESGIEAGGCLQSVMRELALMQLTVDDAFASHQRGQRSDDGQDG